MSSSKYVVIAKYTTRGQTLADAVAEADHLDSINNGPLTDIYEITDDGNLFKVDKEKRDEQSKTNKAKQKASDQISGRRAFE